MYLALTACGAGEIQGANTATTPGPTAMSAFSEAEIPFYACMEQHGLALSRGEDGALHVADKENPAHAAAEAACAPLLPSRPPVQAGPRELAAARQSSACMREQGIAWYPDPDPVTGEVRQADGGTPEQWLALKKEHRDALRLCMPRP